MIFDRDEVAVDSQNRFAAGRDEDIRSFVLDARSKDFIEFHREVFVLCISLL